ncbi:MAG: ATP-binding protein [Thermodesulforhabdaceae bacterium]
MYLFEKIEKIISSFLTIPEDVEPSIRYDILKRNILALMLIVTVVPITIMAILNYHQYQSAIKGEVFSPLRMIINKTRHSFELYLRERMSAMKLLASVYSFRELSDDETLNRLYHVIRKEYSGVVDIGLIDDSGNQVSYAGPYDLKGKNYRDQHWFNEVQIRGSYISDVFLGYRRFPHVAIAIQQWEEPGKRWILRMTINIDHFNELISSMGLEPDSESFLINHQGICQTSSKSFCKILEPSQLGTLPVSYDPATITVSYQNQTYYVSYIYFTHPEYILVIVKPEARVLTAWYSLRKDFFIVFTISFILIVGFIFQLTSILMRHIKESDEKRELAFREMQHSQKLSSIGRLAAGVAHEINNPLSIISEKAGLMKDLLTTRQSFPENEKFISLVDSIIKSVDRCRDITHRLLGFARRMDVKMEILDLNDVIKETLSFLEKEALYRNIKIRLNLGDNLRISSDRGQLQQVFLNIINNAFDAVDEGGEVYIATWEPDMDTVAVTIKDNGKGMSKEVLAHIFEPFFTTKKGYGTGLGLSITYGIVKKLGGDIKVTSKEGEGTTFIVFLPKKPKETV